MYYVYMMASWNNSALYIGITNNLERRVREHKLETSDGFTKRYHMHKLVYYEDTGDVKVAIEREKQLKGWKRERKNELVASMNPDWNDLAADWFVVR